MVRTLLIDGDVIAYRVAFRLQRAINWGDGVMSVHADVDAALPEIEHELRLLCELHKPKIALVALSDPKNNYRKGILPSYKATRVATAKPMLLSIIQDILRDGIDLGDVEYVFKQRDNIECDDILSIIGTGNYPKYEGSKLLISNDKDFRQIPVDIYDPMTGEYDKAIDRDCEFEWMRQVLIGDRVDNYDGCPGIGAVRADRMLEDARGSVRDMWAIIVEQFLKAKLTEADALVQARMARLLRAENYDNKTGVITLWNPPVI